MYTPLMILALLVNPAQAPGNPTADTNAEAAEASATAKKLVAQYVVRFDKSSNKALRMEPEPALRWTNHLGRRFYGDVYVWTHEGRPEVVGTVTSVFAANPFIYTELQSLSTERPVLLRGETVLWEPAEPGVELKPLAGAPKPAATAAARLIQMRTLAAQFSVVADYGIDKEQKEELRLLGAPVFRYRGETDGGLFAFTKGTDPDAFLMIETHGKKDELEWRFAFARFNGNCVLQAAHKGKDVWQVGRLSTKTIADPK